jgi:hypothetical protein
MIRYIWPLDYYFIELPSKRFYSFSDQKKAFRALKKYFKSINKII